MPTRILVGDDNQVVRKTIVTLLQSGGFEVCGEAEDGQQAVTMAKELRPDLIVIDLVMPSMNGFAAAREISQVLPGIPIVLHTLHSSAQVDLEAKKNGICRVIPKSAGYKLAEQIRELLDSEIPLGADALPHVSAIPNEAPPPIADQEDRAASSMASHAAQQVRKAS